MALKAKVKNNALILELPLQDPKVSGSGKSVVIVSTKGPKNTGIEFEGQDLYLVANAFVRNTADRGGKTKEKSKKRSGSPTAQPK
jgi:hypothetical protein